MIEVVISEEDVAWAKKMRSERDRYYGSYFEVHGGERWVGEVGEVAVMRWLEKEASGDIAWNNGPKTARQPDIFIGPYSIDVKTVKRQGAPALHYTGAILKAQADHVCNYYIFVSYQPEERVAHICGCIAQDKFLGLATLYEQGDYIHKDYRAPMAILNLSYAAMQEPMEWLRQVEKPPEPVETTGPGWEQLSLL